MLPFEVSSEVGMVSWMMYWLLLRDARSEGSCFLVNGEGSGKAYTRVCVGMMSGYVGNVV